MTPRRLAGLAMLALTFAGCGGKNGGGPTQPPGPGNFTLHTIPGSATARLDGTAGVYTTASFSSLAAGPHQVALSLPGYADTTVTITVLADDTAADTVALRPLQGTPRSITEVWGGGLFLEPGPVAISSGGLIYLTARTAGFGDVLYIMNASGGVLHETVLPGFANAIAKDLVVDSQGRAYIVRGGYDDYVYAFSNTGAPLGAITSHGMGDTFEFIGGIAIGPGDTLHVSAKDAFGQIVVEKHTPSGFVYAFSTGNFAHGPIEVDPDGTIYLGIGPNQNNPQITKFSRTGALLQTWAAPAWPFHLSRLPGGHLLASSLLSESVPSSTPQAPGRLTEFASSGTIVASWGVENQSLVYLQRHASDASGNVYLPLFNDRRVMKLVF